MESLKLPQKNTKFDFLTDIEMSELVEAYYGKIETIKSLIERFKLPVTTNLENYLPWFTSNELCSHCEGLMFAKPHNRNSRPNNPICLECNHTNIPNCNCQTCSTIRYEFLKKKESQKINLILEHIKQDTITKVEFSKLAADEKISLGILVRYLSSDDLTYLTPLNTKENWNNNKYFILPLINSKILTINPESNFEYIEIKENKFNESVLNAEYYKMKWDINVDKKGMTRNELFQYLAKPNDFYNLSGEQIFKYWQKMAKDEAQKYLEYNFEQVLGIQYQYSLSIQKLLDTLTYHFSIGQIYNLIWKYTNNTLRFINERRYASEDHVHNYLLKCIKTESEKIIKNNYTLEHFNKPSYLGNSIFTDFFFRYVLKEVGQENRLTPGYFYEKYNLKMDDFEQDDILINDKILEKEFPANDGNVKSEN